jgi:DNA sulfur modification protein DndE
MKLDSLSMCQEIFNCLNILKRRTGLNINTICRIGFCLSLYDPSIPNPDDYSSDKEQEIDYYGLTGAWDNLFVAWIKERCLQDNIALTDEALARYFKAHVSRGILLLFKRVRTLNDLALLIPQDICSDFLEEPSHVIRALGFGDERAHKAIRISVGRFNDDEQIDSAIERIVEAARQLQAISIF